MSTLITKKPLYVSSAAVYDYDPSLEKKVTFLDRFGGPYSLCRRRGSKLLVAREACPSGPDKMSKGISLKFKNKFVARDSEQKRVVDKSYELLEAHQSHVIRAPTGFGKTYIGAAVIARVSLCALVVITKSDLEDSWREALYDVLGLKDSDIGIIRGSKFDIEGKKVTIAQVQTLGKERMSEKDLSQFGLVMWDEVHRMGADTFQDAAFVVPAFLRVGLSATTKRSDGREKAFRYHIGRTRVSTNFSRMNFKVVVYRTFWKVPRHKGKKMKQTPGRTQHINKMLAGNKMRNNTICGFVLASQKKRRKVIVFSDLVSHLVTLDKMLQENGLSYKEIGFYAGKESLKEYGLPFKSLEYSASKRVILATYRMASEGTNIPDLDACVMATPKSNVEQIIGRLLRWMEGKKDPVILDLADVDSWVFKKYLDRRLQFYRSKNAIIGFKGNHRIS